MPTRLRVHLVLVPSLFLFPTRILPRNSVYRPVSCDPLRQTPRSVPAGDKDGRKMDGKRKGDDIVRGPEFSQSFRASRFARVAAHDA
ncbi:hypothetical protein LZ31DRAFT_560203 [Colletotrichum somersetense]|nr:hypothetical protein LZ31DRAFT_560203 [Colletotrichum somersetense]